MMEQKHNSSDLIRFVHLKLRVKLISLHQFFIFLWIMAEVGVGLHPHTIRLTSPHINGYQASLFLGENVSCQLRNKELRLFSQPRTAEISLLQSAVCRM